MRILSEFVLAFSRLGTEEKVILVSFVVPLLADNNGYCITVKRQFSSSEELSDALKKLMQDCDNITDPKLQQSILRYLAQNGMCERSSGPAVSAGDGKGNEDGPEDLELGRLKQTERILLAVQDLAEENGKELVLISEVSQRLEETGFAKHNVGGSVDSLLNSQFLARDDMKDGVRQVKLTDKGRDRVTRLRKSL